jgi:hypothetical protein
MSENERDYLVGYRKPPKHTRFKPGQSGNPNGRPKGSKNLKTELSEELTERIDLREGGKSLRVSKQRALVKAMTAKALQGDTKAANLVLNLVLRLFQQEQTNEELDDLTMADLEILSKFEREISRANNSKEPKNA